MRVRFLVDWPALSAEQYRDASVERYPASAVADVSDAFGKEAVAAGAAEATTDDVTVVWKAPEVAAPASEPAAVAPAAPAAPVAEPAK